MKIQDKQSLFSNVNNSYNLYNLKAKVDFSQEELREILESQHLSFLTVKNYLADINHLANWYETEFKKPFSPQNLTPQIFDLFKEYLAQSGHSLKTVNRHSSSIHSLFKILKKQGLITKDPTEKAPLPAKEDSWHIKQFKDYLYVFGAADLTIKNYILDVQHFLDWAQRTIFASDFNVSEEYRFSRLPNLLPEYQERLLKIKGYSPASVKRKLSSLQKYLSWAAKEGYLKELPTKPSPIKPSPPSKIEVEEWPTVPKPRVFPLTHFLSAPIRIFNRFLSPLNLLFETLFITPLAGLILKVKNLIKRTPRFGVLPRPDFYAPPKVGFRGSKTPIFILIVLLLISLAGFSAYRLVLKKEAPPSEGIVSAGKNRTVAFAGKLTDTKGVPITKPVSVYFGLFPSQTTRDELWQETSQIIPDREGKFSVVLGEKTALPGSIFIENESLWLGIKVEGGEELKPRNQIPNVDLARNALYLRGAIPGTQVGANMVPILDSEGNLNLAAKSPSLTSTSGTFSLVGETLSLKTIDNGDIILSPAGRGGVDIQKAIFNSTDSGSVPGAVEIADILSILSTSSAQPAVSIRQDGAGDLLSAFFATQATDSAQISTQSAFIIKNTGFVGIGTSTPAQMLDVQGSLALGGNLYFTAGDLAFLNKSATESARLTEGGKFGLGITSPTSKLHVKGAIPGKALVIFDETGDQDIFVASASGTTKFRLSRTGNLFLAGEIDNTSGEELTLIDSLKVQGTNLTLGNGSAATIKTSNAQLTLDTGSNNTIILGTDDDLLPASSGTNDLGSSSLRWSNIYAVAENLSGDLAVNGGDITSTATTFNLLNEPTTLNIGSTAVARTINIGTGTLADTINIGTGGTSADTITIGNTGSLSLAGTVASSWNVTGANLTLQTTTSGTLALTSAGALNLTGAAASTWSVTSGGLTINSTSANLALQTTTSGNITLAPASTGSVQITSGTTTGTGTSSGLSVAANSLQSGTALDVSSTSTAGTASGSDILLNLSRSGANANLSHTAYGIYSAVTNTNATSGTNIGGYFSASGATTANYGLIVAAGSVGIGDTTPDAALEVLSTTEQLRLTYTDGTVDSRFTVDSSGNLTIDNTGTKTVIADDLQVTGNDILSSTATALTLSGADVTVVGDLAVNGGDLTTSATTFNLLNATATTVNFGGAATTLELGATTGTTSINNALTVDGNTTLGNSSTVDTLTGNLLTSSITSGATTQTAFAITASSLTTGEILDLTGTFAPTAGGTQSAIDINLTNSPVTNANTLRGIDIGFTDAGTLANTVYGLYVDATTANASDTTYAAILTGGNVGLGDTTPDAALEVLSTTEQLRLTYTDGTVDSRFTVDSSGNLTIDNTGTKTVIADDLQINGGDILDSNGNEYLRFTTTASAVNELTITNAAASGTVTLAATGGDTNIPFSIDAKGSGALNLNNTATGDVLIAGGSGATGCTITNSNGNLACSGNITGGSTGTVGYWTRTTTTLSPATANDVVSISSNDTTNAVLALTATGATANAFTLTADSVTTGTVFALSADALTTGKGLDLTSTSNAIDSGVLLNVSSSLTAATDTTLSADIANFSFSPTYSTAVTTPAISGQVLDISRSVTTNNLFASTLTVSGALVSISDTSTQTTGTLTHTANVLSLTQNYTSSTGDVLSISNAGSGDAIEIGGAGTRSINSTSGNLTIKTTTSGNIILDSAGNILDIDDATISLATQATDWDIIDNTASAITISESTNNYLLISTSNDVTVVTLDTPVAGTTSTTGNLFTANTTKTINLGTGTAADTINIGTGGTTADAITLGNNASSTSIALTSGTGSQTFTSSVATGTTTTSAFVFNASSLTSGTALYLTSTATSGKLLDLNATETSGTIVNLAYGAAATQGAAALTGLSLNLNTNLTTPAAGQDVTVIALQLPTASTTSNATIYTGLNLSTAGAITNGTAGSFAWRGANIVLPAITQSAGGSVTASGLRVLIPASGAITTAGTMSAIDVIAPTTSGPAAGTLVGVNIANLTSPGAGTEKALSIGSGWDTDLAFVDTSPTITVGDGGTLSFTDGTNNLMTLADSGTSGTLTVTTINAFAAGGNIDMGGNIISNIGSTDTDFNTSGGLTITLDAAPATAALVVNNSTQASNIFQAQDNGTAVMTIIDGGNVGIGTTGPGAKLDIAAGTLATGIHALGVTGTLVNSGAATEIGIDVDITTQSGVTGQQFGMTLDLAAGATTPNSTMAISAANSVAGTGADIYTATGNLGLMGKSNVTTVGTNYGTFGDASGGNENIGVYGYAQGNKASAVNIGVIGFGYNANVTSPIYLGGYFGLSVGATDPTFTSAALMADNGAIAASIFVARDNGTAVFTIADGGNVGIGTTGPNDKLEVAGNIRLQNLSFTQTSNNIDTTGTNWNINIAPTYADEVDIGAGTLYIKRAGNVGIGTTGPVASLDIGLNQSGNNSIILRSAGSLTATANSQTLYGARLLNGFANGGFTGGTAIGADLAFTTSGAGSINSYYGLKLTGVGAGIANESAGLWIPSFARAGNAGAGIVVTTPTGSGGGKFGIVIGATTDSAQDVVPDNVGTWSLFINEGNTVYLGTGNVGIGTTGPQALLDVGGYYSHTDVKARLAVTGAKGSFVGIPTYQLTVRDTTSMAAGVGGAIAFDGNYTGTTGTIFASIQGVKSNVTDTNYAGELQFYTRVHGGSNTQKMVIDTTGNVGIGTTSPSGILHAYSLTANAYVNIESDLNSGIGGIGLINNVGNQLSMASRGSAGSGGGTQITELANSSFINSDNAILDIGTNAATSNVYIFAGGFPTSNRRLTVQSTGNVGIGTTSPGALLHLSNLTSGANPYVYVSGDGTSDIGLQLRDENVSEANTKVIWYLRNQAGNSNKFGITYYNDSLGTNVDRVTIDNTGNVGIGTTSPTSTLHVVSSATNGIYVTNPNGTSGNAAVYGVSTGSGSGVRGESGTSGFAGVYGVGGGTGTYGVRAYNSTNYALYVDGTSYFTGAKTGFLADIFRNDGQDILEQGDLVCLSGNPPDEMLPGGQIPKVKVKKCSTNDSSSLVGITNKKVPTEDSPINPGEDGDAVTIGTYKAVRVDTSFGAINIGDPLTVSSNPGYAKKADSTKPQMIIGYALEPLINGMGKIKINVHIGWYYPDVYLTSTGDLVISKSENSEYSVSQVISGSENLISRIGAFSKLVVANLRAGAIDAQQLTSNLLVTNKLISPLAEVDELHTNVISPLSSDNLVISLKRSDLLGGPTSEGKLIVENASGSAVATIDSTGNASFSGQLDSQQLTTNEATISGTLRASKIVANEIDGLEARLSTVSAQYITNNYTVVSPTPTPEVSLASPSASNSSTSGVNSSLPTFPEGLMAFGPVSVYDLSVAGNFYLGTNLVFSASTTSLDTLGTDLNIQGLRQGGIAFVGGLVYIDPSGNLRVGGNLDVAKDVTVRGNLAANIISPLPNQDLVISLMRSDLPGGPTSEGTSDGGKLIVKNASGSAVLTVNQQGSLTSQGDLTASGSGTFAKLNLFSSPVLALSDTEVTATSSAGQATLKLGTSELTIRNPLVTQNSLIYLTPIATESAQANKPLYLLRQIPGISFTVGTNSPANADLPFNWLIIN